MKNFKFSNPVMSLLARQINSLGTRIPLDEEGMLDLPQEIVCHFSQFNEIELEEWSNWENQYVEKYRDLWS